MSASDERIWSLLAHLSVPLFAFVGPLIVWALMKDRSRFVAANGVEALNFSILFSIVMVAGAITSVFYIGILIMFAGWVVALVFAVLAAVAANRGEVYRYPLNLRLVK